MTVSRAVMQAAIREITARRCCRDCCRRELAECMTRRRTPAGGAYYLCSSCTTARRRRRARTDTSRETPK